MCSVEKKDEVVDSRAQEALRLISEALEKVDPLYVRQYEYNEDEDHKAILDQVERCFAYELYHQLSTLLDNGFNLGKDIVINAEIPKKGYPQAESSTKKKGKIFPDIVIHAGQNNHDPNKQLLVCEIKRNTSKTSPIKEDIKTDLAKLGWYVKSLQYENHDIGFRAGCFVMTNVTKEELYNTIKQIKKDGDANPCKSIKFPGDQISDSTYQRHEISEVADKITIFSYRKGENGKPEVKHFKLDEIFS